MAADPVMPPAARRGATAIIGAGWAGLAAAVALVERGLPCTLFEASRRPGGRARSVELGGLTVDNGQHVLVGAYRHTLDLMRQVGADPDRLLQRHSLHLEYPGAIRIVAPNLPAPLHLAVALLGRNGLGWREKWAAVRFMNHLQRRRFRLPQEIPVIALLRQLAQPERLVRLLWEPLCVATLNTPVDRASAQVFAHVLRDTLGAGKADAELLLPASDLGQLLPDPAVKFLARHGVPIELGCRIRALESTSQGWQLPGIGSFANVIIATAPQHAARLLALVPATETVRRQIEALTYEPIVTAWFQYPPQVRLPFPMLGGSGPYLQWLFDRSNLGGPPGLLAAVISARGKHDALEGAALADHLEREIAALCAALGLPLPPPLWRRVVVEKRATFACTPGLDRPANQTPAAGLLLAGDYTASDYPATLEGAIRSGQAAARLITT